MQEEIERGYLRRAMTLCQDTDYIVRINMCDGLHCLAAAVGLEVTVATILPEILELMKDEEPLVRVAAINSLVAGTRMMLQSTIVQLCTNAGRHRYIQLAATVAAPTAGTAAAGTAAAPTAAAAAAAAATAASLLLPLLLLLLLLIAKSAKCHHNRLFSTQQQTK